MRLKKGLVVWWANTKELEVKQVTIKSKMKSIARCYVTDGNQLVDSTFCFDNENKAKEMIEKYTVIKEKLGEMGTRWSPSLF